MATAIMKQKEVPEMDDVAEIISKISEDSPYKRRPTQKRKKRHLDSGYIDVCAQCL